MPADLPRLRSLLAAATPGPWNVRTVQDQSGENYPAPSWDPYDVDNALLSAALHAAAPSLLAVAEAAAAWHLADHSPFRRPSKARLLDRLADAVEEMVGAPITDPVIGSNLRSGSGE